MRERRQRRERPGPPWYLLTGFLLGLAAGGVFSIWFWPVPYDFALPSDLTPAAKDQYRLAVARAYRASRDSGRAYPRLDLLKDNDPASVIAAQAQRSMGTRDEQDSEALALLAADRMLRRRSLAASLALAAVLAAMTLGGDPQSAYHAGLLASLYAIILWRRKRRAGRLDEEQGAAQQAPASGGWPRPALLAVSAAAAFVLAAVQVLPSSELTRHSSRYNTEVARTLYELASVERSDGLGPGRSRSDGLLCRNLDRAMHHNHVYHFSVGPWRMVEYLWPNVMGRQFPTHHRWADGIPAEGRLWVPSLYMGLVPLVLALAAARFRRGDCRTVWLSWSAVLAVVASFGWFGAGLGRARSVRGLGGGSGGIGIGPPVEGSIG